MRVQKDRNLPAGSRGRAPVGVWGKAPQTHNISSKHCINTWSTETLDNICSTKSTLQHFQGGSAAPPYPCLRAPMMSTLWSSPFNYAVMVWYFIFTALHAMQMRSSDENSVCLSHAW